ncbi:MAG: hypothetical protein MJ007_02065 [Paludibacteraceae bacterium]|nr:hypothetical protein [Paludibacteraceae bacterium]
MRPRYYWYGVVWKMITLYKKLQTEDTDQAKLMVEAIDEALAETRAMPDGDLREKAINDILIDRVKTYDGVALDVHYSSITVQRWVNSFVNLVGKKAGY